MTDVEFLKKLEWLKKMIKSEHADRDEYFSYFETSIIPEFDPKFKAILDRFYFYAKSGVHSLIVLPGTYSAKVMERLITTAEITGIGE